jgi:two-component system cell cycle response regulator CtrA
MDVEARLAISERENETLRERVRQLELALYAGAQVPLDWGLTQQESIVVGALLRTEMATKERLMTALYGGRIDEGAEVKVIDVFVCKVRKKLRAFGLEIETVWGQGYRMSAAARAEFGGEKINGRARA